MLLQTNEGKKCIPQFQLFIERTNINKIIIFKTELNFFLSAFQKNCLKETSIILVIAT